MTPAPIKPPVAIGDLEKLDIRVGTIREVHEVPGSDKLLRLVVGFGDHERTILSGIKKERPDPAALVMTVALKGVKPGGSTSRSTTSRVTPSGKVTRMS